MGRADRHRWLSEHQGAHRSGRALVRITPRRHRRHDVEPLPAPVAAQGLDAALLRKVFARIEELLASYAGRAPSDRARVVHAEARFK
jgi:hypothetical protein